MSDPGRPPTAFETRVYEATRRIPKGKVTTYGRLGKALNCGSSQAIGQALRRNPFAPEVPCHRVVAGDLTLGGFAGHREGEELRRKRRMLDEEGVRFDEKGRVLAVCVHEFPAS
ncbi:MAG: MGMT family protein [Verrucomicrobiae bacterium]|nr:MGMT family protein [Verrucomicrobiae bacterium]